MDNLERGAWVDHIRSQDHRYYNKPAMNDYDGKYVSLYIPEKEKERLQHSQTIHPRQSEGIKNILDRQTSNSNSSETLVWSSYNNQINQHLMFVSNKEHRNDTTKHLEYSSPPLPPFNRNAIKYFLTSPRVLNIDQYIGSEVG